MKFRLRLIVFVSLYAFDHLSAAPANLDAIVKVVSKFGEQIQNIEVTSSTEEDKWADNGWKPTGSGAILTADYQGLFTGPKFKLDFNPISTIWENGAAPTFDEYKTISYDGSNFITAYRQQGPTGKINPYQSAEISGTPIVLPAGLPLYTGREFFLGSLRLLRASDSAFVNIPSIIANPAARLKVNIANQSDNAAMVIVTCKTTNSNESWEMEEFQLDSDKGYAVIKRRIERWRKGEVIPSNSEEFVISELTPIGNGIWFPKTATDTFVLAGKPVRRSRFSLKNIVVNKSEGDHLFDTHIDPGTVVKDKRLGVVFRMGELPETVLKTIQKQTSK